MWSGKHSQVFAGGLLCAKQYSSCTGDKFREIKTTLSTLQSFKYGDRNINNHCHIILYILGHIYTECYGIQTISRTIFFFLTFLEECLEGCVGNCRADTSILDGENKMCRDRVGKEQELLETWYSWCVQFISQRMEGMT